MTDTTLNRFISQGTAAQRAAFTPSPPTAASGPAQGYYWFETDTGLLWAWYTGGTAWEQLNTPVFIGSGAPSALKYDGAVYADDSATPYGLYVQHSGAWHAAGGGGGGGSLTVGATTIASGTTGRILYDNAGVLGEYTTVPVALGGTGTSTPGLVAGANVTITGSWPNQTVSSSGGGGGSISIVQLAHSSGATTATFGSAPTQGNLLVAFSTNASSNSDPQGSAGWWRIANNGGGTDYGNIYVKIAGAGESVTQSPNTGTGTNNTLIIYEIAGADLSSIIRTYNANPLAVVSNNDITSAPVSSSYMACPTGGLLLFGIGGVFSGTYSLSAGVIDASTTGAGALIAGHYAPSAGTYVVTATIPSLTYCKFLNITLFPK